LQPLDEPCTEAFERVLCPLAGGKAPGKVLDLAMPRVDLGHHSGVATARDHADVVACLAEQLCVARQNRLDAAGDGGGGVVQQRQAPSPRGICQSGATRRIRSVGALLWAGSSSVSPAGLWSTWTRAPSPHSTVKSISPSPTRMPSTLRRR